MFMECSVMYTSGNDQVRVISCIAQEGERRSEHECTVSQNSPKRRFSMHSDVFYTTCPEKILHVTGPMSLLESTLITFFLFKK